MKKIHYLLFSGLFVACLAAAAFALTLPQSTTSYAQSSANSTPITAPTANPHTFGLPAITLHRLQASADGATFTSSDVTSYVNTHSIPGASPTGPKPVVTKVVFKNSEDVSTLLKGEDTGFPAGTLLCYVEFQGTFTFAGPAGKTATYQTGYEVFDAQTGNLVMSGGL